MNNDKSVSKYLTLKPEVKQIFEDLEKFRDFCRFEFLPFDEADLYNRGSRSWNMYYNFINGRPFRKHNNNKNFKSKKQYK